MGSEHVVERPIATRAIAGNQAFIHTFNALRGDTKTAAQDKVNEKAAADKAAKAAADAPAAS